MYAVFCCAAFCIINWLIDWLIDKTGHKLDTQLHISYGPAQKDYYQSNSNLGLDVNVVKVIGLYVTVWQEQQQLYARATPVNRDTFTHARRRVPLWVKLVTPIIRNFF